MSFSEAYIETWNLQEAWQNRVGVSVENILHFCFLTGSTVNANAYSLLTVVASRINHAWDTSEPKLMFGQKLCCPKLPKFPQFLTVFCVLQATLPWNWGPEVRQCWTRWCISRPFWRIKMGAEPRSPTSCMSGQTQPTTMSVPPVLTSTLRLSRSTETHCWQAST